jgi:uncharacterized C2H2 Zn-finger protein
MLCTHCHRHLESVAAETVDGHLIALLECPRCGRVDDVEPVGVAA